MRIVCLFGRILYYNYNMFLKWYPLEAKNAPKNRKLEDAYVLGKTS